MSYLRLIRNKFFPKGSRYYENFWKTQHERKPGWLESYWCQNKRRELLAKRILGFGGVGSVLEVGCNVGANLMAIHLLDKKVSLSGIDINKEAIAFGKEKFSSLGIDVSLNCGSIYELSKVPDKSIDIVFTSAVMMHIPNEFIQQVAENLARIAKRAVVHLELHALSPHEQLYYDRLSERNFSDRWCRNYAELYQEISPPLIS